MPSPVRALSLGVIAALAGIAGLVAASLLLKSRTIELSAGTLLPEPRAIPEFTLDGADGQAFTKARFEGRWSLIFVGFTHCPDVCPNTLGILKSVRRQLDTQKKDLQVVFVSVDPERDDVQTLARYVQYFDPAFLGATGPTAQLDKLGSALGFVYMKAPGKTPETYNIDHSSALILVNPQARLAGYFTPPLKVEALVKDLAGLIPASAS